jgi:hypothetical protein
MGLTSSKVRWRCVWGLHLLGAMWDTASCTSGCMDLSHMAPQGCRATHTIEPL